MTAGPPLPGGAVPVKQWEEILDTLDDLPKSERTDAAADLLVQLDDALGAL